MAGRDSASSMLRQCAVAIAGTPACRFSVTASTSARVPSSSSRITSGASVRTACKTPRAHLGDMDAVREHIAPVEYAHLVVHRQNDGVFNQCFHASSLIKSIAAAQNTDTILPINA